MGPMMELARLLGVCAIALAACGYPRLPELTSDDGGAGGGVCSDVLADPANCGVCDRRCADLPGVDGDRVMCSGGKCQIAGACSAGFADCDGLESTGCEADLSDPETCGGCELQCRGVEPLCGAVGDSWACLAACSGTEVECSGTCADIAKDAAHCGRCNHDCGGGDCVTGQCQPAAVATGRVAPAELAVTAGEVYWSELGSDFMDGKIATCALPRCTLAPRLIADGRGRVGLLEVADNNVYFVGCNSGDSCEDFHRLYQCPVAGCPALPPVVAITTLTWSALAIGSTHAYALSTGEVVGCLLTDCTGTNVRWSALTFGSHLNGFGLGGDTLYVEGDTELRSCPEAQGCASPALVAGSSGIDSPFRAHAGRLYWFAFGGPGVVRMLSCDATSCTSAIFASDADGVSELEVDDTGLYWVNATKGWIRHCPLSGCVGAPAYVATDLTAPKALTLGTGFVYWIEGADIKRVAKP